MYTHILTIIYIYTSINMLHNYSTDVYTHKCLYIPSLTWAFFLPRKNTPPDQAGDPPAEVGNFPQFWW